MIHTRNFIQEGNFESRNFTTEKSSNQIEMATSKMFSQSKNKRHQLVGDPEWHPSSIEWKFKREGVGRCPRIQAKGSVLGNMGAQISWLKTDWRGKHLCREDRAREASRYYQLTACWKKGEESLQRGPSSLAGRCMISAAGRSGQFAGVCGKGVCIYAAVVRVCGATFAYTLR